LLTVSSTTELSRVSATQTLPALSTTAGKQPGYNAVADLNGDGLADAVTANSGSGNLTVLLSGTTATAAITNKQTATLTVIV
jgi:hypothetical protein